MKKILQLIAIAPFALAFTCNSSDKEEQKEGYRPVYMERDIVENIYTDNAKTLQNPGKIYKYGNYILVNEIGKGIHIIDNTDPKSPQNLSFLNIPGNMDMAVNNNILYANNAVDIVAIDISDPYNVNVVSREKDVFPLSSYPDEENVVFECVDKSKGIVVGWEEGLLTNPQCYR